MFLDKIKQQHKNKEENIHLNRLQSRELNPGPIVP